jgi:N-acetylglucosamine kinase-like BadF-type ATPase
LLQATGVTSANQALHLFYTDQWPRSRVATLAPLVDAEALDADAVALEIVNRAAIDLAMLAASVRSQLWQPGEPVDVAYIGGVFESLTLRERFRMLVEMETGSRCSPPLHGPAEGALLEAYRTDGLDPALSR